MGRSTNLISRIHPVHRVLISGILAALCYQAFRYFIPDVQVLAALAWIGFATSYCIISFFTFLGITPDQIRAKASKEDGSRLFLIGIIMISSFASLLNVTSLFITQAYGAHSLLVGLPILGMLLAWCMVHTVLTFHYAHLYYNPKTGGGLTFPGSEDPDYFDFAYFSFVIGMTFQVSDVEITNKPIRRIILIHSLLSFCLNTFVVALTINIVASLRH